MRIGWTGYSRHGSGVGARHGLALAAGVFFAALGTLGSMAGSALWMVVLFAGLILVAVGVDRA